jgi:hypothetical protein
MSNPCVRNKQTNCIFCFLEPLKQVVRFTDADATIQTYRVGVSDAETFLSCFPVDLPALLHHRVIKVGGTNSETHLWPGDSSADCVPSLACFPLPVFAAEGLQHIVGTILHGEWRVRYLVALVRAIILQSW